MWIVTKKVAVALFSLVVLVGMQACGGDSGGGGGGSTTSTTYQGTIAGASDAVDQTGTLSIDLQTTVASSSWFSFIRSAYAASLTATGTLSPAGGSAITLTGTFDDSTGALNLSGSGYTFVGTIDGGVMSGDYDNGDADSDIGGGFAGLDSTTLTVTVYCGTFVNGTGGSSGTFNIVLSPDNTLTGVRINHFRKTEYRTLTGTRSGNTLSIEVDNGRTGTGTLSADGTSVTGDFINGDGRPGTFSGSVGECE